jgi:hypothetical protein
MKSRHFRSSESNRILGVNTAQWRYVDFRAQLHTTRLGATAVARCCYAIEQSIFAAPHTPNFRVLSSGGSTERMRELSAGLLADRCLVIV